MCRLDKDLSMHRWSPNNHSLEPSIMISLQHQSPLLPVPILNAYLGHVSTVHYAAVHARTSDLSLYRWLRYFYLSLLPRLC
jgi:hypothetical protein